jgi:hypothetical protein
MVEQRWPAGVREAGPRSNQYVRTEECDGRSRHGPSRGSWQVTEPRSDRTDRTSGPLPGAMSGGDASRGPLLVGAVVVIVLGVLLALAFVPRTVAEGGQGDATWRLRVSPGVVSPSVELEGPGGSVAAPVSGRAALEQTVVLRPPGAGEAGDSIVVGPTPRGARSIRVTSAERGVGEAVVQRVLWRRIHFAVIDEPVTITDLVAIGRDGQVLDVTAGTTPAGDGGDPGVDAP